MKYSPRLMLLAASALALASPLSAQEGQGESADEEIVVIAKQAGAPMWTIQTAQGTVILVGEITNVPKSTPWRPGRLEEATQRAQRVILGTKAKFGLGDYFRVIFKGGKVKNLPKGKVASDYLDAAQLARLMALETQYKQDYSRKNFLMSAFDLLSKRLRFNHDTGDDATDVVKKAAKDAKIPSEPVGTIRGDDLLDNLFEAGPESHLPCLDAAMTATEIGPDIIEQRGLDWREYNVPAVMDNPLEIALGKCWPWADVSIGTELRNQWVDAIGRTTQVEGVTLAVVPLRVLAEDQGVLDQLVSQGLTPTGPAWHKATVSK